MMLRTRPKTTREAPTRLVELRRLDREPGRRQLVTAGVRELRRLDALRLAHDRAELADDLERVPFVGEPLEHSELLRKPIGFDRRAAQPPDLRVRRLAERLLLGPQLLVDLLARPRADEADRNVPLRDDLL